MASETGAGGADREKYVVEGTEGETVIVGKLGDRILDECPVEYGDRCIDSDCEGRIGETERDEETLSAHELYCFGCGLNWVERGGMWEEKYADWPTSFSFEEHRNSRSRDTETGQSEAGQ